MQIAKSGFERRSRDVFGYLRVARSPPGVAVHTIDIQPVQLAECLGVHPRPVDQLSLGYEREKIDVEPSVGRWTHEHEPCRQPVGKGGHCWKQR